MRIGIGLGLGPDPSAAAREAVRQAKKAVPKPDLALAFGGVRLDQRKVHAALCRELDPAVLMGGSSYAEITPAGVTKDSVAVLLLSLEGARIAFAGAPVGDDPAETGLALARALGRPNGGVGRLPVGLLLTAVKTGLEGQMLGRLAEKLGPIPMFGGMTAGDYDKGLSHPDFWKNHQYSGPNITRTEARLALVDLPSSDYQVAFGLEHGWEPVGPPVEVTRAQASKVFEVGGVPIFEYFRQFLGPASSNKFFEMMVQRYSFSMLAGKRGQRSVLKLPGACDFKDGSITYYPSEEMQGRKVQLIQSNRKALVEGARQAALRCREALGRPPALVLMVTCCTRNAILHSQMDTEVDAVRAVFGREVPIFGYYSGGEIVPFLSRYEEVSDPGRDLSGSHYHTTTVGMMAIASRAPARLSVPPPPQADAGTGGRAEVARLRELLAKSEEILDSNEGFLANLSRKSYRDGEALRKQNEVIHRYTPHDVFRQIGANVARGEYELADAEFNGCFMFMDVKGFTAYSEEHGSEAVVRVLNEIFQPATDIIYACGGDVDKYIGDCIFAAFPGPAQAAKAAKSILGLFSGLKAKGNPFNVRIGVNAGRAVRANVGSRDRREYTYIGDAVNLAQRLESNCAPGRMLLAAEVYEKAKETFSAAERREITVKGKKKSVVAYECDP